MLSSSSIALAAIALTSGAASAAVLPRNNGGKPCYNSSVTYYSGRGSDPEFTINPIQLNSVLSCENGLDQVKNPFLLVPGTWANATMAYNPAWKGFLTGLGYDVCYVAPPPYMTADIQETLQYIVNAVHRIHDISGTTFPIMGHSQGGLAIQSALTYYPSIRNEVSQYISLAGSLHGTTAVPIVPQASLYNTTYDPAVWQQGYVSNWVDTLRQKGGWYNWIPTTTLFSTSDMTVMPQKNASLEGSATYVAGSFAGNILVQNYCPNQQIAHNEFLVANFAQQVVKLAIESGNKYIKPSEVKQAVSSGTIDCSVIYAPNADLAAYNVSIGLVGQYASNNPAQIAVTHAEPLLRPYILSTPENEVHNA